MVIGLVAGGTGLRSVHPYTAVAWNRMVGCVYVRVIYRSKRLVARPFFFFFSLVVR